MAPSVAAARDDSKVQAAFLTKLAIFVTWPEAAFTTGDAPIVTCALEAPRIAQSLEDIAPNAQVRGRAFEVRRIDDVAQVDGCHIVLIGSGKRRSQRDLTRQLRGKSLLTVAISKHFAEDGGMIGIEMHKGRVAFEVNYRKAKKADLTISSKFLRLASQVH